ncbi:MAG: T9SS type A sorting domain-containing protein [Flavobacterium sp.]|nr:T9SS type A sorting domain-containing protein [Flavobacterium sp.]
MNGDYLDDIVTIQNNQMTILTQLTTGGFTSTVYPLPGLTTLPSWSITAGDFDRNGFNDIVLGGGSRLTLIKANNTGTNYSEVPYPQNIFTQRANFIDIDNDGNLDLFACHDVAQSHAYRNDGAGNLIFEIAFFPTLAVGGNYASIWTDYDNDGDMDMYMAKCRGGAPAGDAQRINLLYQNNRISATPSLTYSEKGSSAGVNDGSQSWSTAIEDFDNDGDMDFLLSNISDTNKFYRNNGDGTFTDIYASTGIAPQVGSWELQAVDFDNDGFVDFFWQNGKEIYLNNGDMTFTGYDLSFSEGGIGDLNNDGFLDIQFGANVYYNNQNANNWVKINLQGVQSNRNGIGARVELYGAWGKQIREIRSGHGFSHQSTMNAHFGIGTETAISQIVIKWSSGTIDVINNPNSNQALTVIEGSSPLSSAGFNTAEIKIYPNPGSDYITITNSEKLDIKSISIYSISGKLIQTFDEINPKIKISELQEGLYILNLVTKDGIKYVANFLKKN